MEKVYCTKDIDLQGWGRGLSVDREVKMKRRFTSVLLFGMLFLAMGCGRKGKESDELLDAFLAGEIPAFYDDARESYINFDQLPVDEEDWISYSVGERTDLDNDGENELILNGPYGGMYIDARDGEAYVLAAGEGTAGVLSYTHYDHATWIVHSDTTHAGRQIYWLTRYDGDGRIADEFRLGAEYWDSPDDQYDENSVFTYRDAKISMEEYEKLLSEIFGFNHISSAVLREMGELCSHE
ncbi:MAG: hypothetical protein HFI35_01140 [Roseburia sp.]|jgi:hypothetical protein|nr:hypothetical protein [Roseburia sp.]